MKFRKFLFIGAVVLGLSSCAIMDSTKYTEIGFVTDYSKYDMFITEATSVNFDYTPLGSVVALSSSGYEGRNFINATPDAAVKVLVDNAKLVGAYGIINVKIERSSYWDNGYKKYIVSYTATGMAIKWN